uniref:Uncharacterized protein n=1 Tax=Vespula pensylvanica TaxID=30213 RepID=A0A834N819_VESPE|nr:hypothetical protein H0235_016322 [Vespula pensylvanica]
MKKAFANFNDIQDILLSSLLNVETYLDTKLEIDENYINTGNPGKLNKRSRTTTCGSSSINNELDNLPIKTRIKRRIYRDSHCPSSAVGLEESGFMNQFKFSIHGNRSLEDSTIERTTIANKLREIVKGSLTNCQNCQNCLCATHDVSYDPANVSLDPANNVNADSIHCFIRKPHRWFLADSYRFHHRPPRKEVDILIPGNLILKTTIDTTIQLEKFHGLASDSYNDSMGSMLKIRRKYLYKL